MAGHKFLLGDQMARPRTRRATPQALAPFPGGPVAIVVLGKVAAVFPSRT